MRNTITYENVERETVTFLKDYHQKYIITSSPKPLFDVMTFTFFLSYAVGWPTELRHLKHAEAAKAGGHH